MSKPKFKVQKGLAFIITTGEPVYVTNIEDVFATVTRPVTGTEGTAHLIETIALEMLETRHEQIKRNMEYAEYAEELRANMEQKLMEYADSVMSKPQANKPSMLQALPFNRTDA